MNTARARATPGTPGLTPPTLGTLLALNSQLVKNGSVYNTNINPINSSNYIDFNKLFSVRKYVERFGNKKKVKL